MRAALRQLIGVFSELDEAMVDVRGCIAADFAAASRPAGCVSGRNSNVQTMAVQPARSLLDPRRRIPS
jgi:hypothetical protein